MVDIKTGKFRAAADAVRPPAVVVVVAAGSRRKIVNFAREKYNFVLRLGVSRLAAGKSASHDDVDDGNRANGVKRV